MTQVPDGAITGEVWDILKNVGALKVVGPDGIQPAILKSLAEVLVEKSPSSLMHRKTKGGFPRTD